MSITEDRPRSPRRRRSPPEAGRELPSPLPRPRNELADLRQAWIMPKGWRVLSAVNNNIIGTLYIATALFFFLLAGVLALIMRTQLAVPENELVSARLYNQLFTMHGTVMMFLFAVPVVEAFSVYLLPNLQAARDLPFPRLSAYAFWAYAVGGTVFFLSIFFDAAPDGGWFMYPPLTSYEQSPGINTDFYLLGIGFIEISAIAGAIEIIVGVFKTRAPGQSLDKLPIYSWAMLVFAFMVIFAFPAIIAATLLLEVERMFHWPFFIAEKGGDPLLWQHLFWFFGHPEVYVIFIPAAGFVSMIVPAMARTQLVGYPLVVLALITTGFLSFGLWVHHMFATGIPPLSVSFFSAASMAVAVPTGIQVFAWIATFASGNVQWKVPTYFVIGMLVIFVIGGLTGVMVAMVPFDWQVHDTYFIVAHLHYVLIGGMVFPLLAAIYYWAPTTSSTPLSETLGKWAFWLIFIGVNVTFFTMHITGLMGMPRRNYTYLAEMGWGPLNLISTLGTYMIAAGVLVFLYDLARNFRFTKEQGAGNIWKAGTLEWLPTGNYQTRSIPLITSREPLWEQENLAEDVEAGRYYLPGTVTGGRETIVTSPVDARPQYILQMPGPSWKSFFAAIFTAFFFLGLTVKLYVPSFICGGLAVALVILWLWDTDHGETRPPADIGGGITLPVYATGSVNHSWWGMVVLLLVAGTVFACLVSSYLYLWVINPQSWPPSGVQMAESMWPLASGALFLLGAGLIALASTSLTHDRQGMYRLAYGLVVPALVAASACAAYGELNAGLNPEESSYGAIVYMLIAFQFFFVAVAVIMAFYAIARSFAGRLNPVRRATSDNIALFCYYTSAQGIAMLLLVTLFPRLVGA